MSKKAAVPVGAWDVIDLEPECTLFSTANTQNTSRGCTHGKYLDTLASLASMTPEGLAEKREKYAQARTGVHGDSTAVAGTTPRADLPPREPRGVRTLVPARSSGGHPAEPAVGNQGDRPVCIREEGAEADQNNDEQAAMDTGGEDRQRAVQGGEVHCMADASREDRAPRRDVPKQQREGSRHGGQKRRARRGGTEGGQERTGGGTHRGNAQDDCINGPARDPAGSFSGDGDARERQRRETVTEATRKRQKKKRSRGGGSKGGAVATALDAADDL